MWAGLPLAAARAADSDFALFWGDLHNHDAVGYARSTATTIIPHHLAYKQGWRGANWQFIDPSVSPVMEIYSEHGLSESDRGPRDYVTHSMGGALDAKHGAARVVQRHPNGLDREFR